MKKIVALVLSLVMVLGLATTAFADSTTTTLKKADYLFYGISDTLPTTLTADITKVVTGNVTTTDADGVTTVTYTADRYQINGGWYAEVDSSLATHKLLKGGVIAAYVAFTNDEATAAAVKSSTVATAFIDAPTVKACGDYEQDAYVIKGVPMKAGTSAWAVYNGEFVLYDAVPATTVAHAYVKGDYNTDGTLATTKCSVCKESWKILDNDDVKTMAPTTYKQATVPGYDVVFISVAAATAPSTGAGQTVESAKTFDAGIAMYVGMSVMAAAGSAVVLKKKD